jgi:hypothetical protein
MEIEYTPEQLEIIAEARKELEAKKAQGRIELEIKQAIASVLKGEGVKIKSASQKIADIPIDEAAIDSAIKEFKGKQVKFVHQGFQRKPNKPACHRWWMKSK